MAQVTMYFFATIECDGPEDERITQAIADIENGRTSKYELMWDQNDYDDDDEPSDIIPAHQRGEA